MAVVRSTMLCQLKSAQLVPFTSRFLSTTTTKEGEDSAVKQDEKKQGWISRFLSGPSYNPDGVDKQSHSSMLADTEVIYELQTHDVRNGEKDKYLDYYKKYSTEVTKATPGNELIGSWNVLFGNQDQSIHLWRYDNGYNDVDHHIKALLHNNSVRSAEKDIASMCGRRRTILLRSFSYWGEVKPRSPTHIYDLRSYVLKPGTMIEWGNAWAKGITYRKEHNQNVAGFFAQVGQLYMVFHIWAYKDMAARQYIRQHTWSKPGWDSTVAYTVPLISRMQSKILVPNEFSHLQ
uniref:NIPSNAP domain-containing protein n=1 Tax=Panagrolaimus sp. ES5 TaxID=591445 RepID=A0AC34GT13_9BILA